MESESKGKMSKLNRRRKWIFGILLFLLLVGGVFLIALDSIVKSRVIREVNNASDGMYTLEIKKLNARFFSGAIRMDSVWLKPTGEFSVEKGTHQKKHVPNINFYLDSVSISSIDWFQYLLSQKRLLIGKVTLVNPKLLVKSNLNESESIKAGNKDFLDYLPGIVAAFTGSLQIEAIQIINGKIEVNLYGAASNVYQKADQVNLSLDEIKIDTTENHKVLFSKRASLEISNYSLSTTDGLYKANCLKKISGEIHDSTLCISQIRFYRDNTANATGRDEQSVKVNSVDCRWSRFLIVCLKLRKITFRNMRLDDPDVIVYNAEEKKDTAAAKSPESILEQVAPFIGQSFNVDTLAINNGRFFHEYQKGKGVIKQAAENISMYFTRVKVDSSIEQERLFLEDIDIKVNNYVFNDSDSLKIGIENFHASVSDSLFQLIGIEFASIKKDQILFSAYSLEGKGVNYLDILDSKETRFTYLGIIDPEILFCIQKKEINARKQGDDNFFEKIAQPLSEFKIYSGLTFIENGKFYHSILSEKTEIVQSADNVYLNVNDLGVNKSTIDKKDFFDQFTLKWRNYKIKLPRQNFLISVNKGYANYENKKLVLDTIKVNQLHSFGKHQQHYFRNQENKVIAKEFDFDKFFKESIVSAKEVSIDKVDLFISFNEEKIDTSADKTVTPQSIIKKIPFTIALDTVLIKNSQFSFEDIEKEKESALLNLKDINIGIKNFTNDTSRQLVEPIKLDGYGLLQGEATLKVKMLLPDLGDELNVKLTGSLDSINGKKFNDLLALGGLRLRSGMLNGSHFKMNITKGNVCGDLVFKYNDLKLDLIDSATLERQSRIKNSIANFIIEDNNPPREDDGPKVVGLKGDFKDEDSFIQFVWAVLSDGIITSVTKNRVFGNFVKR